MGRKLSEEIKEKIRQKAIERYKDPIARERMSQAVSEAYLDPILRKAVGDRSVGCKHTEETKKKISLTRKGKGHPHSEEAKKKMSETAKRTYTTEEGRQKQRARMTRQHSRETGIEREVREELVKRGIEFIQEYPVRPYRGSEWLYFLDFFLPLLNVALEADGLYWHSSSLQVSRDLAKDKRLKRKGILVVRLTEEEINRDVALAVSRALQLGEEIERTKDKTR